MKKISNLDTINYYIDKHNIRNILDDEILKHVQLHHFVKEEHILEAEQKLDYYYLLVEGKIKIFYLFENGKSMLLKFYKDFISIGDMELYKNIPVVCNIDAVDETYLLAVPADILRRNFFDDTKFLLHLIESLSDKLYATINNSSYNFVYPLINRLASYLLEYVTNSNIIILNSSYLEIAQFLGTTYRHLNRTINEMESKQILQCEDRKITVLDMEQLIDLSKNNYMKPL